MRTKLLEIVVVLLIAGWSDARPQEDGTRTSSGPEMKEASSEGWKPVRSTDSSIVDGVRVDSRYTGNAGSNRMSYISHYRDSISLPGVYEAEPSLRSRISIPNERSILKPPTRIPQLSRSRDQSSRTLEFPRNKQLMPINSRNSRFSNAEPGKSNSNTFHSYNSFKTFNSTVQTNFSPMNIPLTFAENYSKNNSSHLTGINVKVTHFQSGRYDNSPETKTSKVSSMDFRNFVRPTVPIISSRIINRNREIRPYRVENSKPRRDTELKSNLKINKMSNASGTFTRKIIPITFNERMNAIRNNSTKRTRTPSANVSVKIERKINSYFNADGNPLTIPFNIETNLNNPEERSNKSGVTVSIENVRSKDNSNRHFSFTPVSIPFNKLSTNPTSLESVDKIFKNKNVTSVPIASKTMNLRDRDVAAAAIAEDAGKYLKPVDDEIRNTSSSLFRENLRSSVETLDGSRVGNPTSDVVNNSRGSSRRLALNQNLKSEETNDRSRYSLLAGRRKNLEELGGRNSVKVNGGAVIPTNRFPSIETVTKALEVVDTKSSIEVDRLDRIENDEKNHSKEKSSPNVKNKKVISRNGNLKRKSNKVKINVTSNRENNRRNETVVSTSHWKTVSTKTIVNLMAGEKKNNSVPSSLIGSSKKKRLSNVLIKRDRLDNSMNLFSNEKGNGQNRTRVHLQNKPAGSLNSKNWPNEEFQNDQDFSNYEKYTSFHDQIYDDPNLEDAYQRPISFIQNNNQDASVESSIKKIIQWLKLPTVNSNKNPEISNNKIPATSLTFTPVYSNFEPNRPLTPDNSHDKIISHTNYQNPDRLDESSENWQALKPIYHGNNNADHSEINYLNDDSNSPEWSQILLTKKPVFRPTTHVSQDTVVHILNSGFQKPNGSVSGTKTPGTLKPDVATETGSVTSSNVATFVPDTNESKEPLGDKTNLSDLKLDENCPTIVINSYTKVNNTIQAKEGCTDLNIVINSHVLNTNVFETENGENINNSDNNEEIDGDTKNNLNDYQNIHNDYTISEGSSGLYGSESSGLSQSISNYNYDGLKDPQSNVGLDNSEVSSDLQSSEIFQGTQISINYEPQADDVGTSANETPAEAGMNVNEENALDSVSNDGSTAEESLNGASGSDATAIVPQGPLSDPGPAVGQSNNAIVGSSLQLPSLSNLPSLPSLPSRPSLGIPQSLGGLSGSQSVNHPVTTSSGGSSIVNKDDDDDDDEVFGLSTTGLVNTLTSGLTYFTLFNPLNYGFLSLAAAPFAAITAGILGLAAFIFPWALPSVFDFGRAADKVTIRFRPSLEEVVRQSAIKHNRMNEWKSRKRKR